MIARLGSAPRRVGMAVLALSPWFCWARWATRLIEGWASFDSLYMTVITVAHGRVRRGPAAVRRRTRVHDRADNRRHLGAVRRLGDVRRLPAGGHLIEALEGRSMNRRIEDLRGHTIVCGIGRVGSVVARALAEQGCDFVIVDRSERPWTRAGRRGGSSSRATPPRKRRLQAAGIDRASSRRHRARLGRGQPVRHGHGSSAQPRACSSSRARRTRAPSRRS